MTRGGTLYDRWASGVRRPEAGSLSRTPVVRGGTGMRPAAGRAAAAPAAPGGHGKPEMFDAGRDVRQRGRTTCMQPRMERSFARPHGGGSRGKAMAGRMRATRPREGESKASRRPASGEQNDRRVSRSRLRSDPRSRLGRTTDESENGAEFDRDSWPGDASAGPVSSQRSCSCESLPCCGVPGLQVSAHAGTYLTYR